MTKEEFKNEKIRLKYEISKIKNEIKLLSEKYIESNKSFNIGDRVYSRKEESFGYVTGWELDWSDNVKPVAVKEKKDGSYSKISLYIFDAEDVVLSPKTTS